MEDNNQSSRRKFIQTNCNGRCRINAWQIPCRFLPKHDIKNIKSKGYAAKDASGKLIPWEFERRAVGDNDILIDIKFAGICHSDIHQMKGDMGGATLSAGSGT